MELQNAEIIKSLADKDGLCYGRMAITAPVDEINADNISSIMSSAVSIHQANVARITYLYNYFRGLQPILMRTKKIRPEINNKIVENHAYEAVKFKLSYEFSYPIQYVSRGDEDKSDAISNLEKMMRSENKFTIDGDIAQWMYICGQGYRLCLPDKEPDEAPFRITSVDPRFAFVIYSANVFHKPLAGVIIGQKKGKYIYTVYTPNTVFYFDGTVVTNSIPTTLDAVPLIEYSLNSERMGCFEPVMPIFDEINKLGSNSVDGLEQNIQAIMAAINADIQQSDLDAAANGGLLALNSGSDSSKQPDIKCVKNEVSQTEVEDVKEKLYANALSIMGIPDRQQQTGGGDTGEAVQLRNGWSIAEARALTTERFWNASENQFLKLAIRICKDISPDEIGNLDISNIDIKFTRNLSENLLVKAQSLTNLKTAGINKEMAIQAVGLFSDPHAVAKASTAWVDEPGQPTNQQNTDSVGDDDGAQSSMQFFQQSGVQQMGSLREHAQSLSEKQWQHAGKNSGKNPQSKP